MDDHHELQLQIPHFVYNSQPTLVPGGGAELLPAHWFAQQPSTPFDFPAQPPVVHHAPHAPPPDLSALLAAPLGLPVYSASGFDLLSILARVATRPFPRIALGPVDLTCSFVVVDVRRFDHPIVYCSPSFCTLTGYPEHEVIGRNCRFLQAPGGNVAKGEPRTFTSQDAVNHLRKSLVADKECQTSIVNYKKNGAAFINLVTVIPVPGGLTGAPDDHDIVYQVGFQVDLTEQPHAILDKLRDGSYLVNYASHSDLAPFGLPGHGAQRHNLPPIARDRKANAIPAVVMSKDLKRLLADPTLTPHDDPASGAQNHPLSILLLEALPDFIHVVSLKGSFLYVAPSVRRVLGYDADDMVGTSIADYAHPEDVIPLMRELKESSTTGPAGVNESHVGMPRSVDLLFRAKTKMGRYVWVECRGRLHVEPGKGRKAIILSGRAREMMSLRYKDVRRAGGLARGLRVPVADDPAQCKDVEQEVWGMLGGVCAHTATFMSVGKGMEDVLGWTSDDLFGRGLMGIVCDDDAKAALGGFIAAMRAYQNQQRLPPARRGPPVDASRVRKVRCSLRRKDGDVADVWFVVYRADADADDPHAPPLVDYEQGVGISITPACLVYQIRLADAETMAPGPDAPQSPPFSSSLAGAVSLPPSPAPPPSLDMFDELATARGSSWQYELQQLRISNLRLREELAALEAAAGKKAAAQQQDQQPSYDPPYEHLPPPPPPQQQQHRAYGDIPAQPLFTSQPQQPRHHHQHHQQQQPEQSYPLQTMHRYEYEVPAAHQPTPVAQYAQAPRAHPHQRERATPLEWGTMPAYAPSAGLKRSWGLMDAA